MKQQRLSVWIWLSSAVSILVTFPAIADVVQVLPVQLNLKLNGIAAEQEAGNWRMGNEESQQQLTLMPNAQLSTPNTLLLKILRLNEITRPATTVEEWLTQSPNPDFQSQVTGVRLNSTANGINVILETAFGEFQKLTYWLTQTPEAAHHVEIPTSNKPPLLLDELMRRADTALPGAKTVLLELPATPRTALQVRKKFPQELDEFGWSVVHLNQYTGEVLRIDNALKAPLAQQIIGVIYPLHVGVVGGLGVKCLYVLLGFTPIALFVTGFTIWWSRTYGLKLTKKG